MSEHHLILGGAGFIGRHVGMVLAQAGHRVTIADLVPRYEFPKDISDKIQWITFDRNSVDWNKLVADATVVHDYAWSSVPASANSDPAADLVNNLSALLGLLEALRRRGEGRVVFPSSGGTVYGRLRQTPVNEGHPCWPITAYGASKATAEIYLNLYREMYGIDCRIARPSNPYGAGQNSATGVGAVTAFLNKALKNEPIVIWGDGEVVRDYIHISDVAFCLAALASAPRMEKHFVFNIGTGIGASLNTIVREIETTLQRKLDVRYVEARAFDVPVSVLDIDCTRKILGWEPRVSLSDGIKRTVADLSHHERFSTLSDEQFNRPAAATCMR